MKYRKINYKYEVVERVVFKTDIRPPVDIITPTWIIRKTGDVEILPRFLWDGSSGPAADTEESQSASALHDAICRAIQAGRLDEKWKTQGDLEYYKLCRKNGVSLPRALWRLAAIQFHKWEDTRPSDEILEVP